MSKKDRKSMEELWSKRFDEEAESTEEEPLSRKAKRDREKSISPILTVTLIFMALLIILPTSAYLWWSSRDGMSEEPTGPSVEQVMESNEEEDVEEEPEEENSESEDEEESLADAETDESADNDADTDESLSELEDEDTDSSPANDAEPSETVSETDTEETTQPEESGTQPEVTESVEESTPETEVESAPEPSSEQSVSTYTVKAGDNMYRIAINHGMTTEELMQLNNIQEETVYIGQELRVD